MRNAGQVRREWRRRWRQIEQEIGKRGVQTEIARQSHASVQAICDVEKGRRGPNAKLLRWLGFEVGYLPVQRRPKRATVTDSCDADDSGVAPRPQADAEPSSQPPPPAGG